jgi:hypothetical protein
MKLASMGRVRQLYRWAVYDLVRWIPGTVIEGSWCMVYQLSMTSQQHYMLVLFIQLRNITIRRTAVYMYLALGVTG